MNDIFGAKVFDFPKPHRYIAEIVAQIATQDGDLVLDSFAGSGTTGHAVLDLNKEDGVERRFILVEMDETISSTVTAERLRRVPRAMTREATRQNTWKAWAAGIASAVWAFLSLMSSGTSQEKLHFPT